jgi:hypothetical protein
MRPDQDSDANDSPDMEMEEVIEVGEEEPDEDLIQVVREELEPQEPEPVKPPPRRKSQWNGKGKGRRNKSVFKPRSMDKVFSARKLPSARKKPQRETVSPAKAPAVQGMPGLDALLASSHHTPRRVSNFAAATPSKRSAPPAPRSFPPSFLPPSPVLKPTTPVPAAALPAAIPATEVDPSFAAIMQSKSNFAARRQRANTVRSSLYAPAWLTPHFLHSP